MKLEFTRVAMKEGVYEVDCSDSYYFTDEETVERKEREFIPDITLYRYRDCPYMDRIELLKFKVIKETEASYLLIENDKERWVRKNATRSFAYDDKKDAWRNFKKRKEKQLKILKAQVNRVEAVVRLVEKMEKERNEAKKLNWSLIGV